MKLHINEDNLTPGSAYYPEWTAMYFVKVHNNLIPNLSKEDEKTNARIKSNIVRNLTEGYERLKTRFVVDIAQVDDEYDTLIRMIDIMPYGQYREFASLVIEPYQNLEFDEDSPDIIRKAGFNA